MILSKGHLEPSETSTTLAYKGTSISCYFRNVHLLKWSFEERFTLMGLILKLLTGFMEMNVGKI